VYFKKSYKIIFISLLINLSICAWLFESPFGAGDNWAHFRNGQKYLQEKNYSAAKGNFRYYLTNSKMHARMAGVAHFGLGLVYQDMQIYDKAIQHYILAIKNDLHPNVSVKGKSFMNLGSIYMKRKDYDDAIDAYSRAVNHNDKNGLAHYYLGLSYFKTGRYKEAQVESEKATKLGVPFTGLSDNLKKRNKSESKTKSGK
jgi:tetratricopeptide (TPR) repeat protein